MNENNLQILQLKKNIEKSEKRFQEKAVASYADHESQTKQVNISHSPITHIVKNIKTNQAKFPHANPKEIIHRSIQNFKYRVVFSKCGMMMKCSIAVEKGKGIIDYKELLDCESTGSSEDLAQSSAFDKFLSKVLEFEINS